MRFKYTVEQNTKKKAVIISEYTQVNDEAYSLMSRQTLDMKSIKTAISRGDRELVAALRTVNMYPPAPILHKIADAVILLAGARKNRVVELVVDELDYLDKKWKKRKVAEPAENEDTDVDVDAYADGIVQLLDEPDLATALGRRARATGVR